MIYDCEKATNIPLQMENSHHTMLDQMVLSFFRHTNSAHHRLSILFDRIKTQKNTHENRHSRLPVRISMLIPERM